MGEMKRAEARYREEYYKKMAERSHHLVHFSFWKHDGKWCYRFIGEGIRTLGPVRRTTDPRKLRDMAERGGGLSEMVLRLKFDEAIRKGSGDLYLNLTDEQFEALISKKQRS